MKADVRRQGGKKDEWEANEKESRHARTRFANCGESERRNFPAVFSPRVNLTKDTGEQVLPFPHSFPCLLVSLSCHFGLGLQRFQIVSFFS